LGHIIQFALKGKGKVKMAFSKSRRETVETAKVVIAGEKSLMEGGRIVRLEEIG
jgi:hypothetical protein